MDNRTITRKRLLIAGGVAVAGLGVFGAYRGLRRIPKISGFLNMLNMGHCAPAVMQTLLEMEGHKNDHYIKFSAAAAGGMGCGVECGGLTSPLMMMGMKFGHDDENRTLDLISKGREYMKRFIIKNKSLFCKKISTKETGIKACLKAICTSPGLYQSITDNTKSYMNTDKENKKYRAILKTFKDNQFHCSHAVLHQLSDIVNVDRDLLNASWVFAGGTLFTGNTCGAMTAGVIAIGLRIGEIEHSYPRVIKMIMKLATDREQEAMKEDVNKFNKAINTAGRLGEWFAGEFGSMNCKEITRCSFDSIKYINNFSRSGKMNRCRHIAECVAKKVRELTV